MDIITSLNANFGDILQEKHLPKHHMLHKEGSICNHLHFIKKGAARAFYYKDGQDITAHFATENMDIAGYGIQIIITDEEISTDE